VNDVLTFHGLVFLFVLCIMCLLFVCALARLWPVTMSRRLWDLVGDKLQGTWAGTLAASDGRVEAGGGDRKRKAHGGGKEAGWCTAYRPVGINFVMAFPYLTFGAVTCKDVQR